MLSNNPYAADEAPAVENAWGCDRGGQWNNRSVLDSEIGCYPSDAADVGGPQGRGNAPVRRRLGMGAGPVNGGNKNAAVSPRRGVVKVSSGGGRSRGTEARQLGRNRFHDFGQRRSGLSA